MRYIPSSIIEKVKKLHQTKAENADPKINLVMQRTHRYIEQGSLLSPYDLWERSNLGPLDIAIRRENRMTAPDKLYLIYIESGIAKVAWIDYIKSIEDKNEWEFLYELGPAVDVAAEFDGHWERTSPDAEVCFDSPAQWSHVTAGEPYFFRVLPDGSLVVQQGQGPLVTLADTAVTKVSALRGWKNVYRWKHDHGLICAYIRSNTVCYRNYANQGTETEHLPPAWENERAVTQLPYPAQNVSLFRTNDFRVGFLAESNGEIFWTVTDRNWAGMAIRQHTVIATSSDILTQMLEVVYRSAYTDHTVAVAGAEVETLLSPAIWPQVLNIENTDEFTIIICCDLELYGDLVGLESAFSIVDDLGETVTVTATAKGTAQAYITKETFVSPSHPAEFQTLVPVSTIVLTVSNINVTTDDLVVTYDHTVGPIFHQANGGCFMELDSFSRKFTPHRTNEEGHTDHTIPLSGTVDANLIDVTYSTEYSDHTVTVTAAGLLVDFMNVEDIPP